MSEVLSEAQRFAVRHIKTEWTLESLLTYYMTRGTLKAMVKKGVIERESRPDHKVGDFVFFNVYYRLKS